jgi:PQQ-dependent dehydrogenase (methanol/ethanol family)
MGKSVISLKFNDFLIIIFTFFHLLRIKSKGCRGGFKSPGKRIGQLGLLFMAGFYLAPVNGFSQPPEAVTSSGEASSAPVFSSAQGTEGAHDYDKFCKSCHAGDLMGGSGPALVGDNFHVKWANGTHKLSDLYDFMRQKMPLMKPGSLSEDQYVNILSYVLLKNGYQPSASKARLSAATMTAVLSGPGGGELQRKRVSVMQGMLPQAPKEVEKSSGNTPTDADLRNLTDADWPMYNKDYRGQRYSKLSQITVKNAHKMVPACIFQLGEVGSFQSSPIVYQGVMYITTPHNTYAVDARSCKSIWKHEYTPTGQEQLVNNRGATLYAGKILRGTTDGHLLALDAKDGKLLWDAWVADSGVGYFLSAAPIAFDGKVFIGEAGADWGANGHIHAFDVETGKRVWTFDLIPTGNQPGADSWAKGAEHGGGSSWTTLSYNPGDGLVYAPVGNPAPDMDPKLRPGKNLYTNSVVALDAKTGKLGWYVQQVSYDSHDWDTSAAPVIYDADGRQYMAVANKGGWLYLYDRVSHKLIAQSEVSSHLNHENPVPTAGEHICPGIIGGVEWNGPAFSPKDKMLFINSVDWCGTYKSVSAPYAEGQYYMGGEYTFDPFDKAKGWVRAIDARDGKQVWAYQSSTPMIAGVTPTAGGVLFTGDLDGDFLVFNAKTGKILYRFNTGGGIAGGVTTYLVDGRQYVAVASGNASRTTWHTTGAATIVVFSLGEN